MNNRIKLFLGFLVFTAVVSVFSFSDVFNVARSLVAKPTEQPIANVDGDEDHDGLSNTDESYWNTDFQNPDSDGDGFLDGEEVASGRDPTVPGPDDYLIDTNLTNKLANLALGGLADGSLKSGSPDFAKSLNSLTNSVVDDGVASFIPKQDITKIKTLDSSKESQEAYLQKAGTVFEHFFKTLALESNDIESKIALIDQGGMANPDYIEFFSTKNKEFESVANEWLKIPVPKNWFEEHQSFLDVIVGFSETNKALAGGKDDPVRATVGFNLFVKLVDANLPAVLQSYSDKADAENLPAIDAIK